jgi:hypothetical protein
MNKTALPQNQNNHDLVDRFIQSVLGAMANLQEAGEIAAQAIDQDQDWPDKVVDKCPDMTIAFIRKIEAVGRKKLHPRLVVNESPGVRRLARLPYSLQEKYSVNPVPLLINKNGNWETLQVDVRNLLPDQARQVFSDDGLRDSSGQRAWIEDKATKQVAPPATGIQYQIRGRKVRFLEPAEYSASELASILARIEA